MQLIKENIQPLADDLMSYCQKHLGYKSSPSLHFQEDEQNSMNPLGQTAHYSPDENKVVVYVTGRHVKDVLRSLAHELVHHLQNTRGEFDQEHETGPGYAQKDGHMRNMEKEAYLLGNLLFRDWEDQKKLQESKQMKKSKLEEMVRKVLMEKLQNQQIEEGDGNVKTDKHDDNPKLKGGQKNLPDALQKGIIGSSDSEDDDGDDEGKKMDEQEELEEGGAAMRQGNEDKDQGRERMLPDRIKEEEEIQEGMNSDHMYGIQSTVRDAIGNLGFDWIYDEDDLDPDQDISDMGLDSQNPKEYQMKIKNYLNSKSKSYGYNGNFGDDVFKSISGQANEGSTAIARDRMAAMKGQGVKTADLGKKGPAPKATDRLKREYEEKFANIEATSKLHETKQERLNKRLMEWCTK